MNFLKKILTIKVADNHLANNVVQETLLYNAVLLFKHLIKINFVFGFQKYLICHMPYFIYTSIQNQLFSFSVNACIIKYSFSTNQLCKPKTAFNRFLFLIIFQIPIYDKFKNAQLAHMVVGDLKQTRLLKIGVIYFAALIAIKCLVQELL